MPREKVFDQETILKDATDLFWKNGYHKTSIQDIVDTLGVNRSNLYENYKDKEGLFHKCLCLYRNNIESMVVNIFKAKKTVKSGFITLFDTIVTNMTDNDNKGCLITNTYSELLPTKNKETEKLLEETRTFWTTTINNQLQKAQKNKELKPQLNISKVTEGIYTSIIGVSILGKTNTSKAALANSLNRHLEIFK